MTERPIVLIREIRVDARAKPDRLSRLLLLVLALAVAWQVAQPYLVPSRAEAGREALSINIERVGGRFLGAGALPVRCADVRP
jgi:hypothetical protein